MSLFPGLSYAWWWPVGAAVLGLVAGSFANLAIHFLPPDRQAVIPFGGCPACGARRRLIDFVAIAGWLAQSGRCRRCRAHLSVVPSAVELTTALLWALLAARQAPSPAVAATMAFVTALLALVVIDFQYYVLPDAITLPGIVAGVAATTLPHWPVSLLDSALSAAIGYFAMMALAKAAELYYREEALGQGDWKMVAMLGAFLGASETVTAVLIANGVGAIFGLMLVVTSSGERGHRKLPLGSFLGVSGIAMVLW